MVTKPLVTSDVTGPVTTGMRPGLVLGIDPGTTESGWCEYLLGGCVIRSGVLPNREVQQVIACASRNALIAIEMVASYGMPVGREVFETCVWIGRMIESAHDPEAVRLVYRRDVKLHLCGSPRAKDANIRQALIDVLGAPGTKAAPGATYGVRSHAWAALAVAVTAAAQLAPAPAPAPIVTARAQADLLEGAA